MGDKFEWQPVLCPKIMQDWSSAGAIRDSFWDPFQFSWSFRCGREKLPEAGFNQERLLGVRRKAVERSVLEAEEAPCFLDTWGYSCCSGCRTWERRMPPWGLRQA